MEPIIERRKIVAAVGRAMNIIPDRDMAVLAVAQAFSTSPEVVRRAVGDPADTDSEGGECDLAAAA